MKTKFPKVTGRPQCRKSIHSRDVQNKPTDNCYSSNSSSDEDISKDKSLSMQESNLSSGDCSRSNENLDEDNERFSEENPEPKNYTYFYGCLLFIIVVVGPCLYSIEYNNTNTNYPLTIEQLKKQFPVQDEDFWLNIKVAVEDIINLKQPKSIIFLHKQDRAPDDILESISDYASTEILSSLKKPIVLNSKDLKRNDILRDYGVLISEIKEKLKDNVVVILKNLDEVPGIVAQAFHSLCDEYNPVQEQVLYLFTLKDDNFVPTEKLSKFVEQKLRKRWSDIHNDKFYPLYTRMSIFVLQIQ